MSYECKICFDEGNDPTEFISPCCCSGSMLHVHKKCLNTWFLSKKGTEEYFRCKDCHCDYKRSSPDDLDIVIGNKLTTSALLTTTISGMILAILMLGCGVSNIFCNAILFILYLFTITYSSFYNNSIVFWFVVVCFLFGIYSNRKIKTFVVDFWLIFTFILGSFHFINEGWDIIYKSIKKEYLMNFKSKMFDKFTNSYVTGVI